MILVAPFARFKTLMAVFSEESASSRPFGCWVFVAMSKHKAANVEIVGRIKIL